MVELYFGWDISSSMVGICLMDRNQEVHLWDTINLSKKEEMIDKYHMLYEGIQAILDKTAMNTIEPPGTVLHVIEDRLGGFTKGLTTQGTLMKLAAINAVGTFIISKLHKSQIVTHIAPVSVKSLVGLKVPKGGDKKAETLKIARQVKGFPLEFKKSTEKNRSKPGFEPTPKDGVYDMADAYLLALAGYKKWNKIAK